MKNETFVTAAMLKELGYYFTNPDDEKLFLLFVNELLAENIGQRLVSQLPLKAKVDLQAQYEFDPKSYRAIKTNLMRLGRTPGRDLD